MSEVTVVPKRIGGSLALFLPAEVVRREGICEGVPLRVSVLSPAQGRASARGLLKGKVPYAPYSRRREGFYPEK